MTEIIGARMACSPTENILFRWDLEAQRLFDQMFPRTGELLINENVLIAV
jgi:hypothetical protein